MQQAIDSTLNRNLQIKQALLNVALTRENVKQSRYNQFPTVNAEPDASLNWGLTPDLIKYNAFNKQQTLLIDGSINVQFSLFQGGQLRYQILQNKLALEADLSNVAKIKNDLILSVATTFLQAIASQDLLIAAHQQVQTARLTVIDIQKSLDIGNKTIADLAQAQAQKATTELDEVNIQNQLDANLLALNQLMEMPSSVLELVKPDISKITDLKSISDTTSLWNEILAVNPDVKLAQLRKTAAYESIEVAKSALYPSLFLFGSIGSNFSSSRSLVTGRQLTGFDEIGFIYGTTQPVVGPTYSSVVSNYSLHRQLSDNYYKAAGVTLQIPVFNHFNARTNISKAKITYQNSVLTVQVAVNNLRKIISQALADLRAADKRLAATQSNYNSTKQVLYASEKRYQIGSLSSLDYNIALTNFNKAQFDLIEARYDLIFRNKVIDYYLGKPLQLTE